MQDEISTLAHKLRDLFDPAGLFVLVALNGMVQLVARSTSDAVDVASLAEHFGGGGHNRAAAALIRGRRPEDVRDELLQLLEATLRPALTVGEIMSREPQLLAPSVRVADAAERMQRFGHEGYPVVEDGSVVGLLTRRAVDRAMAHAMGGRPVSSVMEAGGVTVSPADSVQHLQRVMIQHDWGQVPVADPADGQIIGIVTRTDLLRTLAAEASGARPASLAAAIGGGAGPGAPGAASAGCPSGGGPGRRDLHRRRFCARPAARRPQRGFRPGGGRRRHRSGARAVRCLRRPGQFAYALWHGQVACRRAPRRACCERSPHSAARHPTCPLRSTWSAPDRVLRAPDGAALGAARQHQARPAPARLHHQHAGPAPGWPALRRAARPVGRGARPARSHDPRPAFDQLHRRPHPHAAGRSPGAAPGICDRAAHPGADAAGHAASRPRQRGASARRTGA